MFKKWSIRTTLTLVGLLFVSFAAVVGALALTGLTSASTSLSARDARSRALAHGSGQRR
jgi:hypothetical protein